MQVHGLDHGAPHVMLPLPVRVVADSYRPCSIVSTDVVQHALLQVRFAVDAVHDLQLLIAFSHVGEKIEVVVRFPVEPQRVQRPQREWRIADPAVAIVPVALAIRRFW